MFFNKHGTTKWFCYVKAFCDSCYRNARLSLMDTQKPITIATTIILWLALIACQKLESQCIVAIHWFFNFLPFCIFIWGKAQPFSPDNNNITRQLVTPNTYSTSDTRNAEIHAVPYLLRTGVSTIRTLALSLKCPMGFYLVSVTIIDVIIDFWKLPNILVCFLLKS